MTSLEVETIAGIVADIVTARLKADLVRPTPRTHLSIAEFAQSRSLGRRTVERMIQQGRLAFEKEGRRTLIPIDAQIN